VPGRRRRINHVSRWISATAGLTAGLVSVPLVYLFVRAFEPGLTTWAGHVFSGGTLRLLYRTLGLTAGVVLLANLVALPAAWLVTRTDLPGRRVWAVLAALPLAFPSYIAGREAISKAGSSRSASTAYRMSPTATPVPCSPSPCSPIRTSSCSSPGLSAASTRPSRSRRAR